MRTIKQFMLLVMTISMVSLTSCKSDDDGGSPGAAGAGTIEASIDGTAFTSLDITSIATLANGNLIIQGNDADGRAIVITIFGYNGTGTYNFDGNSVVFNIATYTEADINNPMNSQSWAAPFDTTVAGSVSVSTETDDNVQGTFEFTGQNANDNSQKVISNGSFNLTKQVL
ncbi:DUF6252 family protein [Winogradskyella sp. 3972H.M.0a.05]|uniref:DUF6252 family protein n=1 Tax=Winogradskyella sp. 3972H.M.0a.05 TaxID=2950277 RepID=UPI003398694A